MKTINSIDELRKELAGSKNHKAGSDCKIGLVPTMGYLHDGHLALVEKCRSENAIVVVSIFVNPTQFGPNEDLDKYPRDIARDEALLEQANVDFLFYPDAEEMYPPGFSTSVHVSGVTERFCGASRPGHFDGVAQVVTKLFNIVKPDNAYFGLKDYQQFQVIKRFVKDLNMDIRLTGVPIVREADGLALSSRNVYLSADERQAALSLSASFSIIEDMLAKGSPLSAIKAEAFNSIDSTPLVTVEYFDFADPDTLDPVGDSAREFVCLIAAKVGKTRLIDNRYFAFESKV